MATAALVVSSSTCCSFALGYPPAVICDRGRCLKALRPADQGDDGTLGEMLARAVLDSLYKFIVPARPARLVSLPVLANKGISVDPLRTSGCTRTAQSFPRRRRNGRATPESGWRRALPTAIGADGERPRVKSTSRHRRRSLAK